MVQLCALKFTIVSPLQPLKALSPMEVTELGIVTDVNPVNP